MNNLSFFKIINYKKILSLQNIICLIIASIIFFIDRVSKIKIIEKLENQNKIFINDFINYELVWNTGIGFGLLNYNAGYFYNIISFIIFSVIIFITFILFKEEKNEKYLLALILGGAIGNFYDRVTYYAVPDFIDLHIKELHWFTFNIADIFITIGIVLILIKEIFMKKNNKN